MTSILEIKKGARVRLANGWEATVEDNQCRQHTRLCTVYGDFEEMGSVYSTDIILVQKSPGVWDEVVHTEAQNKAAEKRAGFVGLIGW